MRENQSINQLSRRAALASFLVKVLLAVAPTDSINNPAEGFNLTLPSGVTFCVLVPLRTVTLNSHASYRIAEINEVAADWVLRI